MRLVTLVVGVYKGVYSMKSAKKKNLAAWKGTKFILTVQVKVLKRVSHCFGTLASWSLTKKQITGT